MSIKGLLLLWSGIVEMSIKGLLLLWSRIVGMTIKGLLLLWFGFGIVACKKSKFRIRLYLIGASGSTISDMCDFHLLILDLNFIKKSLIDKRFFFWETFDFFKLGSFEIFVSNFETLEPGNFFLKLGTEDLKFWALKFWKLRFGILIMKSELWTFFFFNFWKLKI